MRLSPHGTHFTAESTEAMRIKSLAQGENILMLRFEPATIVSKIDILTTTPIVHNWRSGYIWVSMCVYVCAFLYILYVYMCIHVYVLCIQGS